MNVLQSGIILFASWYLMTLSVHGHVFLCLATITLIWPRAVFGIRIICWSRVGGKTTRNKVMGSESDLCRRSQLKSNTMPVVMADAHQLKRVCSESLAEIELKRIRNSINTTSNNQSSIWIRRHLLAKIKYTFQPRAVEHCSQNTTYPTIYYSTFEQYINWWKKRFVYPILNWILTNNLIL